MHPGKRVMLLWDPAGQSCRGRVDNSLEDGSLSFRVSSRNFAQQEVEFCDKVHDLFEITETLWTLEDLVKNWFLYISAECSFRLFYNLTCVSAAPTTQGRTAESQAKDLNSFGELYSVSCSNRNVKFSWDLGKVVLSQRVRNGGNIQNFESVNKTSKVDVPSARVFLLFFCVTSR